VVLQTGRSATIGLTITTSDTAQQLGSGDVPVLATPRIVALAEQACVAAIAGALDEAETSVGVRVEVDHLRATPVGGAVRARAVLTDVDGARLTFAVTVHDGDTVAATCVVRRQVVDRAGFLERAYSSSV